MRKPIQISILIIVLFLTGCVINRGPGVGNEYNIPIPEWVIDTDTLTKWMMDDLGATMKLDLTVTGYKDYPMTPAEFMMTEIPDLKSGGTMVKEPMAGDCEDWAAFIGYVTWAKFGWPTQFVVIADTKSDIAHALIVAKDGEKEIIMDYVRQHYANLEEYMKYQWSNWVVCFRVNIQTYLETLYRKGHIKVYQGAYYGISQH
jgi:hypothetical protein